MTTPENDSIYQKLPRKPNFSLILVLSGVTIIVLFIAAYLFLTEDGRKLMPHPRRTSTPNAQVLSSGDAAALV